MTTGVMPSQAQEKLVPWWLLLLQGCAALLMGLLLLTSPVGTTLFLIQFLGWYWLINGIFAIVGIFLDSSLWGWKLLSGVIGILAGLAIINHPLWSAVLVPTTLVWIMGVFGLVIGCSMIIQALRGAGAGTGILGALSCILGVLLLARPVAAALSMPWVFAIFAIAGGTATIIMAFRIK
jgi:uncharacterized membrane protein HdeD (DUF308 family)